MTRSQKPEPAGEHKTPDPVAALRKAIPLRLAPEPSGLPVTPAAPRPVAAKALSARRAVLTGVLTLVVLLGGFGLWSVTTSISGAVVASGQVEVDQRRQVVQHPDGGVVQDILVHDGEAVQAGQVLIRLDGTLVLSERAIVEGQFFEVLARRGRLEAERADLSDIRFNPELLAQASHNPDVAELVDGQERLFRARLETLSKTLEQVAKRREQSLSQIRGIDAQLASQEAQQGLIERELKDQRGLLEKGLAQASRVMALEREAANLAGGVGSLVAERAQAEGRITELELEALRLSSQRREQAESELRDIGYRELELAERRRALSERIDRLELRAPTAGLVYAMSVTTPRSVIRPAEPVLYIVPQDRPLVVAAQVSPINIDEVTIGQPVALRFSAFASRTTPEIFGHVSNISADALVDEATRAPYFRVEIMLNPGEMSRLGELALLPGMPAEVHIRTQDRSPLAYLSKPLTDYFIRAFREE